MEVKKYFAVQTKCGHVGRNYYIPITFAVVAESKKEAARIGRLIPRVKHNHKDAIIDVREIDHDEYVIIRTENSTNEYLKCNSIQEQNRNWTNLYSLKEEDGYNIKKIYSKESRKERINYKMKKIKITIDSYYRNNELICEYA